MSQLPLLEIHINQDKSRYFQSQFLSRSIVEAIGMAKSGMDYVALPKIEVRSESCVGCRRCTYSASRRLFDRSRMFAHRTPSFMLISREAYLAGLFTMYGCVRRRAERRSSRILSSSCPKGNTTTTLTRKFALDV
jgi:hypothetical protein